MHELDFLTNLGMALLAAVIGGMVARALRLPLLVGYILAGIAVGPNTPGLIANAEAVHAVAKLGVALLMFAVGVQFHLEHMLAVRRIALVGGGIQILGTILLGALVGMALGWGLYGGVFLGCALSLSSTAVMMRVLEERGELGTNHATAMLGILVVQDLSLILMVTLLPSLASFSTEGSQALTALGISLLRAGVAVSLTLFLAFKGVPALLERVARTGSQELFLLVVVSICLVAAYLAQLAGLSLEIGAFLAGLVISESDYAQEVFSQIRPLRDVFASLFFVSVGMLLVPAFVVSHALTVLIVVAVIIIGKSVLTAVAVHALGSHGRTAILAGLGLAQIGEFSFVLSSIGTDRGLIGEEVSGVILAAALITILLTPFVYGAAEPLYARLNRQRRISQALNRHPGAESHVLSDHDTQPRVIILGCGRVGKHVSQALTAKGVEHAVVDYDANVIARLRSVGIPVVYGDASSEVVVAKAMRSSVELAVVALPESSMTPLVVRTVKRLRPDLPVIARVHRGVNIPRVRAAGADFVIHAEFEASSIIIRHGLERLGCTTPEIEEYLTEIRRFRYRQDPTEAPNG
ncbi:MAG: cation:proton antiporter [Actinomycetota bacterium]